MTDFLRVCSMKKSVLKEFEKIIGMPMYSAFRDMLKKIGPDARTERISVVIAAMLQFALCQLTDKCEEEPLGEALIALSEEPYLAAEQSGEYQRVATFIDRFCRETGMQNKRQSSSGTCYSIAEHAISHYVSWYNMPWEDPFCG